MKKLRCADRYTLARIVGAHIANRRKQKGMTQVECAKRLGMGADSLSRIEKGVVAPRFPRLEQIAETLDCQVAELFRPPSDSFKDRAESVADIMHSLSPKMQEEVVVLLASIVTAVKKAKEE